METGDAEYTKDGTVDYRKKAAIRKKTGTWKACFYILGSECFERLAYWGLTTNLLLYFKNQLNQQSSDASRNLSNWNGTCFLMPLLGAFLADSHLGAFWTTAIFSITYVIGLGLLTLSVSVPGLRPTCHEKNECHATSFQTAICFAALYVAALGIGGRKPCASSFGANQFDDADESESCRKSSFFNWFFFAINIGATIGSSVLVYIQVNIGWGWGFGIPAAAMAFSVAIFFSGTRSYRHRKPRGSPLTRICQVAVASLRKYRVDVPDDKSLLYDIDDNRKYKKLSHTNQFHFLDKAAVKVVSLDEEDAWRLCTVTQVEELKGIVRLLPVWATGIIYSTVFTQMGNLFLLQAEYMDTRVSKSSDFKIPEASLVTLDHISVLFWVPVYDRCIVPLTRKLTGRKNGLTQLQRIGTGLLISVFGMVAAGLLETVRLGIVKREGSYEVRKGTMSIFWQVPQYFIIGCSEVFMVIGQLEFFYEQAPESMRSLCAALSLTTNALGNYLCTLLVTIVMNVSTRGGSEGWIPDNLNRGHLHSFFVLLAAMSVVNFGAFVAVAKRYGNSKVDDKQVALVDIKDECRTIWEQK